LRPGAAHEGELARILLVQACEESDPAGRFVPRRERDGAAKAAHAAHPDAPGAFVAARARALSDGLEARHAALRGARRAALLAPPGAALFAGAAALGLAADALGAGRRINLLAFPLLALLAWNLGAYLTLALGPLLLRRTRVPALAGALGRAGLWLAERRVLRAAPDEARWLGASLRRFGALWREATGALLVARVRRLLHLGSLGFALGLLAGMYLRGLVFEYRAGWESTFLGPAAVSTLLRVVLGPAAALLDALGAGGAASFRSLLAPEAVATLRAPADGGGPAAPWIHLWALTAAAVIGAPRALLAVLAGRRARRLAAALAPPLGAPYYLRLLAADRGEGLRVRVWPYSHRLSPRAQDRLLELLHELFGNRAQLEVGEPVPYGGDPPADAPAGARVAVFNLAQSPEQEVHGAFLEALLATGPTDLLVLLDEEPYAERLGGPGSERLAQRRRAWERLTRELGLRSAPLRAPGDAAVDALAELRDALAPAAGTLR
jgi:hypothetical protein